MSNVLRVLQMFFYKLICGNKGRLTVCDEIICVCCNDITSIGGEKFVHISRDGRDSDVVGTLPKKRRLKNL